MASRTQRPPASSPVSSTAEMTQGMVLTRKKGIGRRAFVVGATTGILCGAGALVAPRALSALEAETQALARAAVMDEIGRLEGVSLDAAIGVAELTRRAVTVIVLPLARFVELVGSGALDLLLKSVDSARAALSILHLNTAPLNAFRAVVESWRSGITTLPITLDAFLTADITSAETYLRALKRLADHPTIR